MISNKLQQGIYDIVAKYLQTGNDGPKGKALHIAAITASAYLNAGPKYGKISIHGKAQPFLNTYLSVNGNESLAEINKAIDVIARGISDPNIEGIPIRATRVVKQRQVDVSEQASIVQSKENKEYNIDNAVPRLRRWQIDGYLAIPQPALDFFFTIKPSLLLQVAFLDACSVARTPVWFKDNNNEFFQVLITSFQSEQTPDATNAIKVSIGLIEYKPFEVEIDDMLARKADPVDPPADEGAQV